MIINIPINIDEKVFEDRVQREYDAVLVKKLTEIIEKTLVEASGSSWRNNPKDGMYNLINDKLDAYMKEYKDEIIAQAAERLAERLARTKKAKEILEEPNLPPPRQLGGTK